MSPCACGKLCLHSGRFGGSCDLVFLGEQLVDPLRCALAGLGCHKEFPIVLGARLGSHQRASRVYYLHIRCGRLVHYMLVSRGLQFQKFQNHFLFLLFLGMRAGSLALFIIPRGGDSINYYVPIVCKYQMIGSFPSGPLLSTQNPIICSTTVPACEDSLQATAFVQQHVGRHLKNSMSH